MKLTPIRTLFATSYAAYREAMWHLITLEVLPMCAMLVVGALAFSTILVDMTAAAVAVILIGVVLTIILSVSVSIAMVHRVHTPRTRLNLRASLEATRPLFLSYIWVVILGALFVLLGLILFIIPGIVIAVWLCFSYFTVILEERRGMDALKASKELVRGLWFAIFGRLVLLVVAVMLIMMVVTLCAETIFGKGDFSELIVTIANLIVSPFGFVYTYQLYVDVKRAKHRPSHEPNPVLA